MPRLSFTVYIPTTQGLLELFASVVYGLSHAIFPQRINHQWCGTCFPFSNQDSNVDFLPVPLLMASFKSSGLASPRPPRNPEPSIQAASFHLLAPEHFQTMKRVWYLGLNATYMRQHHIGSLLTLIVWFEAHLHFLRLSAPAPHRQLAFVDNAFMFEISHPPCKHKLSREPRHRWTYWEHTGPLSLTPAVPMSLSDEQSPRQSCWLKLMVSQWLKKHVFMGFGS